MFDQLSAFFPLFLLDRGQSHCTIKGNASTTSSCHVAFAEGLFSHLLLKWFLQVVKRQTLVQWVPPMVLKAVSSEP